MKILLRDNEKEKWKLVKTSEYSAENELQNLLAEEPTLVSIDEAREGVGQLVTTISEFPLNTGYIDILGFTGTGEIAIVECKLASNEESKRKVIGQLFDYGSHLWQTDYETVDEIVKNRKGQNLAELVRVGVDEPDWDEELFRKNVKENLNSGNFILIIVVDQISDELNRIMRFINEAGQPSFTIAALEMRRYKNGKIEILIPHVYGPNIKRSKTTNTGERKIWNEDSFFEDAKNKLPNDQFEVVKDIYHWSEVYADQIKFGNGITCASFSFYLSKGQKINSVFSVFSDGLFCINFGALQQIFPDGEVEYFRTKISEIESFKGSPKLSNAYCNLRTKSIFFNEEYLTQFKREVLALKGKLDEKPSVSD